MIRWIFVAFAFLFLVLLSPAEARHYRHHHRAPPQMNGFEFLFGTPVAGPAMRVRERRVSGGGGNVVARSGATAHVSESAAGSFQCIITALEAEGYPIKFMGGWRAHGSVRGSLHPAGLALDINQTGRGQTSPRMPANEVVLANSCGLISGAQWANNDSGHFQLGGWGGGGRHRYYRRHRR